MWQRFTERARLVVFFAQEEARKLGENYVSTEHILLGLLREDDSVAVRLLIQLDFSPDQIREETLRQLTQGAGSVGQDMQLTPRGKRVIDLAYDEAQQLSVDYIGTEHLLLGLVREGDGLAGRILTKLGVDLERTRREVSLIQDNTGVVHPDQGGGATSVSSLRQQPSSPAGDAAFDAAFVSEFDAMSEEDRAAITGPGIALNELSATMRQRIYDEVVSASPGSRIIPQADGAVRVHVTMISGARHFTITVSTVLFITILALDPPDSTTGEQTAE